MGDIVNYLTDTESLIQQYGTLVSDSSTLGVHEILTSVYDSDGFAFNELNY